MRLNVSGNPAFWQMLLGFILLGLVTSGLVAHLVPLLRDRGITSGLAASALSMLGMTMIVGRIATGALLDRFRAPPVVCACVLASTAGLGLLQRDAHSGWAFAAVVLVGFTVGAELDFMSYLISRYQGLKYFGRIYGLMYGAFILGSGIGPLIMGYAQQRTGSYQSAISALTVATIVAAGLFATLGPYPDRFGAA